MLFKRLALEYCTFYEDNKPDMWLLLENSCRIYKTPASDYIEQNIGVLNPDGIKKNKKKRRDQDWVFRDMITSLILCHNVTPVINNSGEREL